MKFSTVQLVAAVVVVMSVCLLRESVAHSIHRPLSAPLHSADTDTMVQQVAQHAQNSDIDTDTKLMPDIDTKKNHRDICCLHANILDFYLSNILTTKEKTISRDLKEHGCAIKHYNDHHHSIAFRKKFSEMEEGKGIKKAIGEIDILFTFLKDFCVHA
uniref:Interleukin-22 n=1 Tax=Oncorhynchus tshawytscha TaxID=74940 RepID=A0AAZ3NV04_ONCTS